METFVGESFLKSTDLAACLLTKVSVGGNLVSFGLTSGVDYLDIKSVFNSMVL